MVTEINPALCQGCGTCVAACPSNAITGTQFSNEQVLAQLEGLLMVSFNGNGGSVRVLEPEVA
jgi:heterodisulfide reductase subunit A